MIHTIALSAILGGASLQLALYWGLPFLPAVVAAAVLSGGVVTALLRPSAKKLPGDGGTGGEGPFRALTPNARTALTAAVVLTLVALAVRSHDLLGRPAWDDEMWTLRNIYTSDWGELLRVALDDYWPPLYYLILNTVARTADTSLFWLRLPSVLFGAATVLAVFLAGRRILKSEGGALTAAVFLTAAVSHVLYSQEARVYALQVLLVVVSCHLFYRSYWERRISPAYLFVTALLTYTHSFASWYVIAAQTAYVGVAWLIWRDRMAFVKGFASQALNVVLWMPLVGGFFWARVSRSIVVPTYWATGPEATPGLLDWVELYQSLAVRSWAGAALFGFLMLMGAAAVLRLRTDEAERTTRVSDATDAPATPGLGAGVLFLLLWCTVPLFFSHLVTAFTSLHTFGESRYHLGVLPGMCLLAGAGLAAAARRRAAFGLAMVAAVAISLVEVPRHFANFSRDATDKAVEIVRDRRLPGELIYIGGGFRAFAYYYRGSFPRIGSPEWEALAQSTAADSLRFTLESVKLGDTYAFEKMPSEIRYYPYYFVTTAETMRQAVQDEKARGGFSGSYWLVLRDPAPPTVPLLWDALDAEGIACMGDERYHVQGLVIRRCAQPTPVEAGAGAN